MTPPPLHIVIVNYRTGGLVVDCLASLEAEVASVPGMQVTVVDNASNDDSCRVIAAAIADRHWAHWADLVRSPVNGGFAYGNNLAIRAAMADADPPAAFWLLNPDTRVSPGAARALIAFLRDHPRAGIAGTALIEGNGQPWPYAFRFPGIASEAERGARFGPLTRLLADRIVLRAMSGDAAPVDWVSGASMVVRSDLLTQIGLIDDGYFLYFEETDLCLRASRAGWQCWYVPDAAVIHLAGQSTGLAGSVPATGRVPRYWFESRRRYFIRNHGRAYAMLADIAWALGHLFHKATRRMRARPDDDPPLLLSDFVRNSSLLARGVRSG